jgi:chromosome segregation ATPase
VTAIDQMARVYRWAYHEKKRTLEDLVRLAERLRADIDRLDPADRAVDPRRHRLERSIGDIEATIGRAREDLTVAEAEYLRVEQKQGDGGTADKTSIQRRNERAAGLGRPR